MYNISYNEVKQKETPVWIAWHTVAEPDKYDIATDKNHYPL